MLCLSINEHVIGKIALNHVKHSYYYYFWNYDEIESIILEYYHDRGFGSKMAVTDLHALWSDMTL